ncbi:hypothetical protein Y032_0574g175, partial [Ancylostoma ceylanicum]
TYVIPPQVELPVMMRWLGGVSKEEKTPIRKIYGFTVIFIVAMGFNVDLSSCVKAMEEVDKSVSSCALSGNMHQWRTRLCER